MRTVPFRREEFKLLIAGSDNGLVALHGIYHGRQSSFINKTLPTPRKGAFSEDAQRKLLATKRIKSDRKPDSKKRKHVTETMLAKSRRVMPTWAPPICLDTFRRQVLIVGGVHMDTSEMEEVIENHEGDHF
jgi:hypothetical protein